MHDYFLSNNNFIVSYGIVFPAADVLGIILYPCAREGSLIHLSEIRTTRSAATQETVVSFIFSGDTNTALVGHLPLSAAGVDDMSGIAAEYKIHIIDTSIGQGCGCMVVSGDFVTWAAHLPKSVKADSDLALCVNPSYVYNNHDIPSNYSSVNGTEVSSILFSNINASQLSETTAEDIQAEKEPYAVHKVLLQAVDGVTLQKDEDFIIEQKGMQVLCIKGDGDEVYLGIEEMADPDDPEGKIYKQYTSIGVAIAPMATYKQTARTTNTTSADNTTESLDRQVCRVHVVTSQNKLSFRDQSLGL